MRFLPRRRPRRRRQFSARFDVKAEIHTYFDYQEDTWVATITRPGLQDSRKYSAYAHSSLAAVDELLNCLEEESK